MQCVHICICILSGNSSSSSGGTYIPFGVCFWSPSIWNSSHSNFKFTFCRGIELKEKLNIIKKGKWREREKKNELQKWFLPICLWDGWMDAWAALAIRMFCIKLHWIECWPIRFVFHGLHIGFHVECATIADNLNGASYTSRSHHLSSFYQ